MWTFKHTPHSPDWAVDWAAIRDDYAWIRDMHGVQQEPEWHAEGDVEVHTRMVAEAMAQDPRWREAADMDQHVTFAAALLHDAAKPACTRFEEGRWTSPKHTRVGEHKARVLLWRGETGDIPSFEQRERIAKLVRYHGLPLNFLSKPDPARAVIEASMHVNLAMLSRVAFADVRGRKCQGREEMIDKIALFEEYCEEQGCLHGPKHFESDHHRFMYFAAQKPYEYVPYDAATFEATLMSGLPGSGKSTWVKANAGERPMISLDDLREEAGVDPRDADQSAVVNAAKEQAKAYLRAKRPFIWDATNITRDMRGGMIALLANYGARTRIVYVETSWNETVRRNCSRKREVAQAVLERMAGKLEVPSITEAHRVEYVVSSDRERGPSA